MTDLERRYEKLITRAENLDNLPMVSKIGAASQLFTDTKHLMDDLIAENKRLWGRVNA